MASCSAPQPSTPYAAAVASSSASDCKVCRASGRAFKGAAKCCGSNVEQEVHHVAVVDDVVLAFGAHLARVFRTLLAFERDEVVEGDRLRADEAALEVGVDHAGRLRRGVADVDGPGAHLLHAGGEVGL